MPRPLHTEPIGTTILLALKNNDVLLVSELKNIIPKMK